MCLCHPLVKVDVKLAGLVLAAHHEWLLQSLDVLSVQVLAPLAEVLPHHLIHNVSRLFIGESHLLGAGWVMHEVGFLKHLEGEGKGTNEEEVKEGALEGGFS